jgi:hypothetical protein
MKFNLMRVDVPQIELSEHGYESDLDTYGAQYDCGYNIPPVFRALANPSGPNEFVKVPTHEAEQDSTQFTNARSYWVSFLTLLVYSFGWRFPGQGIKAWLVEGMPDDDPRFALIKQTWLADGQFDAMCGWLWQPNSYGAQFVSSLGGIPPEPEKLQTVEQGFVGRPWLERTAMGLAADTPNPLVGGGDPLHLHVHVLTQGFYHDDPVPGHRLVASPDGRSADLFVESMNGWYRALVRAGSTLTHPEPGRSVRVRVHCAHVGTLGEYRRSRETGVWFSGPHSLHMLGN